MSRIQIIESDVAFGEDLARSLRRSGWEVDHRRDLGDDSERSDLSPSELALIDVSGPRGFDWLERLSTSDTDRLIVAMGAGTSSESAARARQLGARAYLRKPFGLDALEAVVADVLGTRGSRASTNVPSPVTESSAMRQLLDALRAAAATDATIQLVGELGTGKSSLARCVHAWSPRRGGPLRRIECGALVSGDSGDPDGWGCAGGTAVLEDVDALPAPQQAALLQALQERGPNASSDAVRLVVTTRRSLRDAAREGGFLEALRCRLDVIRLDVPPLRERLEDLPALAMSMLGRFAIAQGVAPPTLSEEALDRLATHRFPGNLRELANLMRRAVVLFPGESVDVDRLQGRGSRSAEKSHSLSLDTLNLREIEKQAVLRSLAEHGGHRTRASQALGISVRTLRNKIREYGLT